MIINVDIDNYNRFFKLRFQYDANTINKIRSICGRKWDAASHSWLIPVSEWTSFKQLNLEYHLSDKAKSYFSNNKNEYNYDLSNYIFRTKPYQHQKEGLELALRYRRFGLFHEMGLGKSKIAIDFCDYLFEREGASKALVICSKSLKYNWKSEFELHSKYADRVMVVNNEKKLRKIDLDAIIVAVQNHRLVYVIATYDTIRLDEKIFKNIDWDIIILDECQKIKNRKAKRTASVYSLKSKYRLLLTGTFIANKPEDAWCPLHWLRPDIMGSYYRFLDTYCIMGEYGIEGYRNLDDLQRKIMSISIRKTKSECLDLPEKIYRKIQVVLDRKQWELYKSMRDDLIIQVRSMDEQEYIYKAQNILVQLLRLVQLASNPGLLTGVNVGSTKFEAVDDLLKECCITNGNKVIIWTNFVKNIDVLWYKYKDIYGAEKIYGDTNEVDRLCIQEKFNNDKRCRLLIANPATAGEGLNLQVANIAIFIDRTFSKTHWLQSQDRIHRIGQNKKVEIIVLIGINTIDEYIDKRLNEKQRIADFLEGTAMLPASKTEFCEVI